MRSSPALLFSCSLLIATLSLFAQPTAAQNLDIYWIDVEGGAATLIVTPGGQTVLMDAGWAGRGDRDPQRIAAVLDEQVGRKELDYFITSHFHLDHVGGVPGLAKLVPIKKFVDHGDSVEIDWDDRARGLWEGYLSAAQGKRMQVAPGDKLPVDGVEFLFVAARSKFLDKPLAPAANNPLCAGAEKKEIDKGENGKSVGFVVRFGDFEFLDLGDLSWNYELEIACPRNLLGEVDLYQVTHHGMSMSGAPAHIQAIKPQVAVMNNGPHKGGEPATYRALLSSPGLEDLWQGHQSLHEGAPPNTALEMIANLDESKRCQGHWIKASVQPNGSFTITNSRNGFSKTYQAR